MFQWMSNPKFLAFMAHFGWACWIVLLASVWLGPWWAAGLFLCLWAVPKEFVFDLAAWGEGDTLPDSLLDFAGYVVGSGLGVGLWWLTKL